MNPGVMKPQTSPGGDDVTAIIEQGDLDFAKFHQLEQYVFDDVATSFRAGLTLSAFDFFCIVIWKANRAKSKIAKKLLERQPGYANLEVAVAQLSVELFAGNSSRDRLEVLW